jgi:hypothetical protein
MIAFPENMGKHRKFWLVGIAVIIVALTFIIYYNYNIQQKMPRLILPPTTIDVDTKKGDTIYPSKLGGDEWFMDPVNLDKDKRFDPNAELTKNSDGSWSIDSNGQTRLRVWTMDSDNFRQQDEMNTYNHNIIKTRGYWYKPSDWKNVEMTGYFKLNEYVNDEYSMFSRSIWHNRNQSGCGGSDYKLQLNFDGTISSEKEEWHVYYTDQPEKWSLESGYRDIQVGNLTNKWVGLKIIVYNIVENAMKYPKMEMWIDQTNNNTWKKVYEYIDTGGWGSTMGRCGGASDELITWGSPVATFRWDKTDNVDFRNLSIREIEPPT